MMALAACHGIFNIFIFSRVFSPVDDGVISYHALIHAVKSQQFTIIAPKSAFADTKLLTMYRLGVYYILTAIFCYLFGAIKAGINKEVIIVNISYEAGITFFYCRFICN